MSLTRKGETTYFFFIQERLWKIIEEHKLSETQPARQDVPRRGGQALHHLRRAGPRPARRRDDPQRRRGRLEGRDHPPARHPAQRHGRSPSPSRTTAPWRTSPRCARTSRSTTTAIDPDVAAAMRGPTARPGPARQEEPEEEEVKALAALAAVAIALSAAPSRADGTADEADLHFRLGANDYRRGDYEAALAHFLQSNRLAPNRNVVFNIATAYEQLQRYADAHRYYVEALAGETDAAHLATVRAAIARVAPHVAVLDVETDPARRDASTSTGRTSDPGAARRARSRSPRGRYRVIAELEGYEPATSAPVVASLGREAKVALTLRRIVGTVHVDVEGGQERGGARGRREDRARVRRAVRRRPAAGAAPALLRGARASVAEPRSVTVVARGRTNVTAVAPPAHRLDRGAGGRARRPGGGGRQAGGLHAGGRAERPRGAAQGARQPARLRARRASRWTSCPDRQAQPDEIKLVPLREVTAVSRYQEALDDAPSSVTIISSEEIARVRLPDHRRRARAACAASPSRTTAPTPRPPCAASASPTTTATACSCSPTAQSLNDNIDNSLRDREQRARRSARRRPHRGRARPRLAALRHRRVLRRRQPGRRARATSRTASTSASAPTTTRSSTGAPASTTTSRRTSGRVGAASPPRTPTATTSRSP